MESFILIIGFGAILQGLFLSALYIFSKKHKSRANIVLGLFLFALIWEGVNAFLPIGYIGSYPVGDYFGLPESKLFMPALFLHYVLAKINRTRKYKNLLKTIYSLGFIVASLTVFNITLTIFKETNIRVYLGNESVNVLFMAQQVVAYFLSVIFILISMMEIKNAKILAADYYSDPDKAKLSWVSRFIYLFIPVVILWGVELARIFLDIPDSIGIVVIVNWAIIFVLLYYVSFKAFSQSDLFLDFAPIQEKVKSQEDKSKIMLEIEKAMTQEGYYKNPELNLHELSKMLNLGARKLSESIKEINDCNFSTWVNTHRVNAAIKLIENDSNLSLEGIGQEVGFKSRSAMYVAFKKIKGCTPGEFKR